MWCGAWLGLCERAELCAEHIEPPGRCKPIRRGLMTRNRTVPLSYIGKGQQKGSESALFKGLRSKVIRVFGRLCFAVGAIASGVLLGRLTSWGAFYTLRPWWRLLTLFWS